MHLTVEQMWRAFAAQQPDVQEQEVPQAWHFCDNENDADECARLVLSGRKRATAPSLWSFEQTGEPLPEPGDLNIVTNWKGFAACIIRTTQVQILAFNAVTAWHADMEGEGDGSLAWWRDAHWAYYQRESQESGRAPEPDMPIVFQCFERIFPLDVDEAVRAAD